MAKKRRPKFPKPSTAYQAPTSTTISSSEGVNALLARLRALGHPDSDSPRPVPATRSVPPQLQQLLSDGGPSAPPPPPRRGGVRNPRVAGPPPPASWLATPPPTELSEEEEDPGLGLNSMGQTRGGGSQVYRLPGIPPIDRTRLLHKALVAVARNWSFHVEYDQHYLYALSASLKAQLLSYIALHNDEGVGIAGLRVLFKNSHEEEDGLTTLDLSRAISPRLNMSQLESFLRPLHLHPPPPLCQSEAKVDAAVAVAASWDSVQSSLDCRRRRLPALTHLSLAYPRGYASWGMLLSLVKVVPTITHLSLAGWGAPYQGAVRQLAKTLLCLKWLDVSDCSIALYDSLAELQAEWWGVWRGVETIVAKQGPGVERAETRKGRALQLASYIKATRQGKGGGKWCKVLT